MSNKTETKKLNKLAVKKETINDLAVNNAGEVKGGATVNQGATDRIRCHIEPKTANGTRCETSRILCPL